VSDRKTFRTRLRVQSSIAVNRSSAIATQSRDDAAAHCDFERCLVVRDTWLHGVDLFAQNVVKAVRNLLTWINERRRVFPAREHPIVATPHSNRERSVSSFSGRCMELVGTPEPIRLLIAVAVRVYRDGLAATLSEQSHLRIDGTAATPLETQRAARELQPDVVIVDVSFQGILDLFRALRVDSEKSRILAFAVEEDLTTILNYVAAGAHGFVTANGSVEELVESVERALIGEALFSPRLAAQLLRQAAHLHGNQAAHAVDRILTSREQQVWSLLKQGRSNKEIARELTIAEATVKNHVHHVLEKLQVSTRGQAAAAGPPLLKATLTPRASHRAG
jgi:two-component system nitrate/nitrite response regulator NarL